MSSSTLRFSIAFATLLGLALPALGEPREPLGRWATPGLGSVIELAPCASGAATLCGRIVWLWQERDESGALRADVKNPDPALRRRPLHGVEIVRGLREASPGLWTGAELYNPDDGRWYTGEIRVRGTQLELRGCALRVFCQTQLWHRPAELLARLAAELP
jgi:uncharacterized protein (DUF2147 family)